MSDLKYICSLKIQVTSIWLFSSTTIARYSLFTKRRSQEFWSGRGGAAKT